MTARVKDVDVSRLPTYAFGHQGLIWWGTLGFMVIEGTMFLVVFVVYFYLRTRSDVWPPSLPHPDVSIATLNLAVLWVSCLPNQLAKWAAERFDLRGLRLWMNVALAFGVATIVLRGFEYPALASRWDSNAYGSIVWVILGLHSLHLVTDVIDTAVLAVLMHTGPIEEQRYVDVSENSLYWYFVVLSYVPVYIIIYVAPRVL